MPPNLVTLHSFVPRLWHVGGLLIHRVGLVMLWQVLPSGANAGRIIHMNVKWMHLCYVALGFAVARWIFRRQPAPVSDPVARFRSSGLL